MWFKYFESKRNNCVKKIGWYWGKVKILFSDKVF